MAEKRLTKGQCRACSEVNDAERLYCNGCGEKLFELCLACKEQIGVWERFCGKCGAKQASDPKRPTKEITEHFRTDEEFRKALRDVPPDSTASTPPESIYQPRISLLAEGECLWCGTTNESNCEVCRCGETLKTGCLSCRELMGIWATFCEACGTSVDDALSNVSTESLSKYKGELLILNGLTSLSDAAAESLSKHEGGLALGSLTSLSDAAAESLSKYEGSLYLDSLRSLSDEAAESLCKHKGGSLDLDLDALSDSALEILLQHPSFQHGTGV